jgi:hypothetical protein
MKCFICRQPITVSVRKWVDARTARERSKFRDLCKDCYKVQMMKEGYREVSPNCWKKEQPKLPIRAATLGR